MRGKRLSSKDRARVRELHREGKAVEYLADEFKLHCSTIYRILTEGNKKERKKGPRKLLVGRSRQKLLHVFRENPTISATKAAKMVGLSASSRTIRRELRNSAFTFVKKKKVQSLTKEHKEKRLDFARKNVTRPQDQWDRVIFTDEKKWNLCGNDGYISAWIEGKNNEIFEQITNRCGGLMVWGAISAFGGICLICPEGKITAETYVKMLEDDFLSEYSEKLPEDFIFMHDNAPPHRARSTAEYLEMKKIEVLEWPPLSPDLNPIENLWGILSKKVYHNGKSYKNTTELWDAIVAAWNDLPLSLFRKLYDSMGKRLVNVLEKRGERIKL